MLKKFSAKAVTLLLVAITLILPSCSDDMFGNNQPTDIKLSSTLMEFDTIDEVQGRNLQLTAEITLKGGGVSKDVKWEPPEDASAFKVQSTAGGVLTFQIYKSGTYVISAHADYEGQHFKTAQCVITINDALTQLRIYDATSDNTFTDDNGVVELTKGNTVELSPIYTPTSTSQVDVLWSVDKAAVATISAKPNHKAVLTAVGPGRATVTLMSQENTSILRTLNVIVNDSGEKQSFGLRSVELTPSGSEIQVGKSMTFTAKVLDGNSNEVTTGSVEFGLSNTNSFAMTNKEARSVTVTAAKGGEGMLTATYTKDGESVYTEVPLTVTGDVQGLSPSSSYINLSPGEEETINISYMPADTTQKGFELQGLDTSILGVIEQTDSSIRLVARREGSSEITILSRYNENVTARLYINVTNAVTNADRVRNIQLDENIMTIDPPYSERTINAEVFRRMDDGTVIADPKFSVDWSSSDTSVLTVTGSGNSAVISPKMPGTARVTATSRDNPQVTAVCLVTVTGNLRGLVPSVNSVTLKQGETTFVNLVPSPYNAVYETPFAGTSNDNVSVQLEQAGNGWRAVITGAKLGPSTVSYYVGDKVMATTEVSVYQETQTTLRSIELSETLLHLRQDADRGDGYITAYALDSKGERLADKIFFDPADEISGQVARIDRYDDNTFYVIPLNAGTADWFFHTEKAPNVKSRLHIEVGGAAVQGETLRAIRMPFDSLSMTVGAEESITLATIPLGAETGNVTWTVSDGSVLRIAGNGAKATISAIASGKAEVKAETDSGLNATLSVTVFGTDIPADTTISKAVITGPENSQGYKIFTLTGKAFELTAHAYHADGSEVSGEEFTWTISGEAAKALDMEGQRTSATFLTDKMVGFESPAVITATSVSNPSVSATFLAYTSSTATIPEETPVIFPEYSAITLEKGKSMDVKFSVYPATYNKGTFRATSSESCISVEMSENGRKFTVNALEAGTAIVTVSDGTASFSVRVTVVEKAEKVDSRITALTLDRTYLSYDLADKALQSITATVWRGAEKDTEAEVIWESSDPEVVRVSSSGNMVAVMPQEKTGSAFITAKAKDNTAASASCLVEVIDSTQMGETLRYIMLSESSVRLEPGATIQLTVSGQPESVMKETRFVWEASPSDIVSLSNNGLVTALEEGVATVTVKAMNGNEVIKSDSCRVTVKGAETIIRTPASVKLSENIVSVSQEDMDKTFTIYAGVYDESGEYISGRPVLWDVDDPEGAIEYGFDGMDFMFSPRSAGVVTVTASTGTITATAKIIVGSSKTLEEPLRSITVWPSRTVVEAGKDVVLNASPVPATSDTAILWSVSDGAVELTGNDRTATFNTKKPGQFTVTAYSSSDPSISAEATVIVEAQGGLGEDTITGIVLDKRSIVLDMAEKALTSISATVYANGEADASRDVVWTYSEGLENVVGITEAADNTVILTKLAKGEGYITATSADDDDFSATCLVEVIDTSEDPVESILAAMISSTSLSLEKGSTYQFGVTILPEGLKNVTTKWTSSDANVATVSSSGLLTAVGSGRATITATIEHNGKILQETCAVNVYSPVDDVVPSRIAFSKKVINLSQEKMDVGEEVTATVYGSDGSILTGDTVTWRIEPATVASITPYGNTVVLRPLSAGTANVYANYQGLENSFVVITGAEVPATGTKGTGIMFSPGSLNLKTGSSAVVEANVIPAGAKSTVAFSVNNPDVIKAKYTGNKAKITGLSTGTAVLKAVLVDNPSITSQITVNVSASTTGKVTAVTLDKSYISLVLDTKDLTVVNANAYVDGKLDRNVDLEWSLEGLTSEQIGLETSKTNNGSMAYLTKKDKTGTGWLVCRAKNEPTVEARCRIEIINPTIIPDSIVKRIDLSSTLMNLSQEKMDSTYQITATVFDSNDRTMSGQQVQWSVTDSQKSIEWQYRGNSIFFSPRNAGTALIKASIGNVEAEAKIVVGAPSVSDTLIGYSLNPTRITMEKGSTATVSILPIPSIAEIHPVWASDNKDIATVTANDSGALISAVETGTAVITVKDSLMSTSEIKGEVNVTVKEKGTIDPNEITSLTLDNSHIVLDMAEKSLTALKATVYVANKPADREVQFTLDEGLAKAISIERLSNTSIGINKKAVGAGWISATVQNPATEENGTPEVFTVKCYVEVIDTSVDPVTEIIASAISSNSVTLKVGATYQYRVDVLPANLVYTTSWHSSDERIAKVSETGLATAMAAGRATITATILHEGKVTYLTSTVNVYDDDNDNGSVATYVTLSDNVIYLVQDTEAGVANNTQVSARVLDQNRVEMYGAKIKWSIENESVAKLVGDTFDPNIGTVATITPVSAGSTLLTATCGNAENSMLIVVGKPENAADKYANAIVFSPSSAIVGKGDTIDVTAHTIPAGSKDTLTFSKNNENITAVPQADGKTVKITGIEPGVSTLLVRSKDNPAVSALLTVNVVEDASGQVTSVVLDKTYISLEMDNKEIGVKVNATAYVDGAAAAGKHLTWTWEPDEGVTEAPVTINVSDNTGSSAFIVKQKAGTGYIKVAADNGVYAKCRVEVSPATSPEKIKAARVVLSENLINLSLANEDVGAYVSARILDTRGNEIERTVTWSVDSTSVVSLTTTTDGKAYLLPLTEGSATLTASVAQGEGTITNSAIVVVTPELDDTDKSLKSILVYPSRITLIGGGSWEFEANTIPAAYDGQIEWSITGGNTYTTLAKSPSDKGRRVTLSAKDVDETVNITLQAYATLYPNITAEVPVTIIPKDAAPANLVTAITLDRPVITIDKNNLATSEMLTATVYIDGQPVTDRDIKWDLDPKLSESLEITPIEKNRINITCKSTIKVGGGYITATTEGNRENDPFVIKCFVNIVDTTVAGDTLQFITLSDATLNLYEGETARITASGYPAQAFEDASLVWSSDNTSVAVVSGGKVTALKKGTAIIKATAHGTQVSKECKVNVLSPEDAPEPSRVVLNTDNLIMTKGEAYQLQTEFIPVGTSAQLLWSSTNDTVASVDSYGRISAKAAGTATITATNTVYDLSATCAVTVNQPSSTAGTTSSVTMAPGSVILAKGDTVTVKASGYPVGLNDTFTFTTSNAGVVETENGTEANTVKLTATGIGTAIVTATSTLNPTVRGTTEVTVLGVGNIPEDNVTSIEVEPGAATVYTGKKTSFTATPYTSAGVSDKKLTWSVEGFTEGKYTLDIVDDLGRKVWFQSDEETDGHLKVSYKNLDANGNPIMGTDPEGNTYELETYSRIYVNAVKQQAPSIPKASRIQLSDLIVQIPQSQTAGVKVSAYVVDENGDATKDIVAWSIANTAVATITTAGNTVTILPVSAGKTVVKATFGGVYSELAVIVGSVSGNTGIIAVTTAPDKVVLEQGKSWEITAGRTPVDATAALSWSSSAPQIVSVTPNETDDTRVTVKGLEAGEGTVTAYVSNSPSIQGSTTVTVYEKGKLPPGSVTALTLTPASMSFILDVDEPIAIQANVFIDGVRSASEDVEWASSDATVANVTRTGTGTASVEALKEGSCYITATSKKDNSFIAKCYVKVAKEGSDPKSISDVRLNSGNVSILIGGKIQLTATVYPSTVTNYTAAWSSSDVTVAKVSETGEVEGVSAGSAIITYTVDHDGKQYAATCTVNVDKKPVTLERIHLSDSEITLRLAETYTPTYTLIPSGAKANITWGTSDPTKATVSQNGTITGVKAGSATITAHSYEDDKEASLVVTVLDVPAGNAIPSFIRLSTQEVLLSQLTPKKVETVSATVIATDGYPVSSATVTWTIDNSDIADMTVNGNAVDLKAKSAGRTTLRAWYGNLSSSVEIYCGVKPDTSKKLDHLTITPSVLTVQTTKSGSAEVTPYPGGITLSPVWESQDVTVATIGEDTVKANIARITGVKEGRTTVSVRDTQTDKTQNLTVRVFDDISNVVTGIMLDKSALTFDLAEKAMGRVTAQVYVNNTLSTTAPVEWTVLKEDLTTPSDLVTITTTDSSKRTVNVTPGTKTGSAYIRVTASKDSEMYSQLYVKVIDSTQAPAVLTGLKCEVDSATLSIGSSRTFKATGIPADAPVSVRWSIERQNPNSGVEAVITLDENKPGRVTAVGEGVARIKAYDATKTEIADYIDITVTSAGSGEGGGTQTESVPGTIEITPGQVSLSQEALYPTAVKATVYDTTGKSMPSIAVTWDSTDLADVAVVDRTEGNTIYLKAKDAGSGHLVAKLTRDDGTVITGTADVVTGGKTLPEGTDRLQAITFSSSQPIYLVAGDGKSVKTDVRYTPNDADLKGLVWTAQNAAGYIAYTTTDDSIIAYGVQTTPNDKNATVTATTIAKGTDGNSISETLSYKVVPAKEELPTVTTLVLDRTALVFNLSDATVPVAITATGYDYEGNVVPNAHIEWSLRNNTTTNVSITNNTGRSTQVNKGTATGMVELVAKCGDIEAVCGITVTDVTYFEGITLSAETIRLSQGGNIAITVYGNPANKLQGDDITCNLSGDVDAITVSHPTGSTSFNIQAHNKTGTTYLRFSVTVDDRTYTADAAVYVNAEEAKIPQWITLTPTSVFISNIGETKTLTARLLDRNGDTYAAPISFRAEDPSVVEVTAVKTENDGSVTATVKGLKKDATSVYAFGAGLSSQSYISVGSNPEQSTILLRLIPGMDSVRLQKNQTVKMALSSVPAEWVFQNIQVVSSRTSVATGEIKNGELLIKAYGEGTAIITVSEGSVYAEVEVTVSGNAVPASIEFDQTSVSLLQTQDGNTAKVKAYVYDKDKVLLNTGIDLWQTSDASIAEISSTKDMVADPFAPAEVTVKAKNSGSAVITAHAGTVASSFRVGVTETVSPASSPSRIDATQPKVTVMKGDTVEVEVLYEPMGLSSEAKRVSWTASTPGIIEINEDMGNGKAAIMGLAVGTTSVVVESTASTSADKPKTVFTVTVVDDAVGKDLYRIELEPNKVRLNPFTETLIKSRLFKGGQEVPANDVVWTVENNAAMPGLLFVEGQSRKDTVTSESALVYAGDRPGYAYVLATYGSGDTASMAKAQIEVESLASANNRLTAVSISTRTMMMEVGESATFKATALPSINGTKYTWSMKDVGASGGAIEWTSADGNSVNFKATHAGTVEVTVTAQVAGAPVDTAVIDSARITIVEKGSIDQTFTYSQIVLDNQALTLEPDVSTARLTAQLMDSEGNPVSDVPISGWAVLDSRGNEIFNYTDGKYALAGDDVRFAGFDEFRASVPVDTLLGFSSFEVLGTYKNQVQFTPDRPGVWFIEARGPVENGKYVSSRAMVEVSGDISDVAFASEYIHMIVGETADVSVSIAPANAVTRTTEWTEQVDFNGGVSYLTISEPTDTTAKIHANKIGTTRVVCRVVDAAGTVRAATLTVEIHDPSYGKSGIRGVSFPTVYPTASYPYSTTMFRASAVYMDGSTAEDADIRYQVFNCDGSSSSNSKVMGYIPGPGEEAPTVATYTVIQGSGVRVTPLSRGTFKITATLTKDGTEYSADMFLSIGGNTSNVTAASKNIVLYTGGSAKIGMTTDKIENAGSYRVTLVDEYSNTGYRIIDGKLEGTDKAMESVFTTVSATYINSGSVVIGTKSLPTEEQVRTEGGMDKLNPDTTILPSGVNATLRIAAYNEILETFPRTAVFRVDNYDGTGSTEINVTVNQLPVGNTYPVSLSLNSNKMDLTPPFTSEQTMVASLKDLNGNETLGTVNWYYYPMGDGPQAIGDGKNILDTKNGEDNLSVNAYFSPDTKTIYFKPKMSGLYRLTAESIQNPQLNFTATLNVGGSVTGITTDVGSSLMVEKSTSSTIKAVFTPANALARRAWFAVDTGNGYYHIIDETTYENDYISVTVNSGTEIGDIATVYGKLSTGNDHRQTIRVFYPQTTQAESLMKDSNHLGSANGILAKVSGTTMTFYAVENGQPSTNAIDQIEVFSYATTVDVYANKTTYTFKVSGDKEVNPNALQGNKLTYTVSTNSNSTDKSFSNWDWVEAKLRGSDTGMVYASSVPVDNDGHTLYLNESTRTVTVTNADSTTSPLVMQAGLYYPDPAYCTASTVGVSESELVNYNSYRTVEKFFYGAHLGIVDADKAPAKVISNTDMTVFKTIDGTTILDPVYEVYSDAEGKYIIRNGVSIYLSDSSLDGTLALVRVPAPLSSLEKGRLLVSDNNQTYEFAINNFAIPTEPLLFEAGISEKVQNNNASDKYFDNETEAFRTSDTTLFIGGKIQSISVGSVEYYNNNTSAGSGGTNSNGQFILIEGASAVISLAYNPTYTHQKEVEWEVVDGSMETLEYLVIPSKDSTQATIIAKKLQDVDTKTIHLRAKSVYNPNVTCDVTVIIDCVVKSMNFVSSALTQTNKADRGDEPKFKLINDQVNYPDQVDTNIINCYDYADVAGDSALIDAYEITMSPSPAFGYEFKAEIVEGSAIGELSTAGFDSKDNKFRFIPKGRIYNEYDKDGVGIPSSGYDVTYGDVIVRVTCQQLNYSRDFTINYGAAAGRLVRAIPDPYSNWRKYWDVSSSGITDYLYGLEAIVLYEGESFPVTMIDFNKGDNRGDNKAKLFKYPVVEYKDNQGNIDSSMSNNPAEGGWSPGIQWSVSDSFDNVSKKPDARPDDPSFYGEWVSSAGEPVDPNVVKDNMYYGGLTFTINSAVVSDDPRINETTSEIQAEEYRAGGAYGEVCTIYGKRQGIYKLNYKLIDTLKDSNGTVQNDTNGNPIYIVTVASIPVYVISRAEQTMVAALNAVLKNTGSNSTIATPIKQNISRNQLDKWYLPSKNTSVSDSQGNVMQTKMYRGKTWLVFDHTMRYNNALYVGLNDLEAREFSSLYTSLDGKDYAAVDFTGLPQDDINKRMNDVGTFFSTTTDTEVTGCSTTTPSGSPDELTRYFHKIEFGDIKLTGENGIASLKKIECFVLGPGNDVPASETNRWTQNNVDASNIIDLKHDNIKRVAIKNMDMTPAEGIRFMESHSAERHLIEFELSNSTFPSGTIYDDERAWEDNYAKLVEYIRFENVTTNKIALNNFNNLKKLTIGPVTYAGNHDDSRITLKNLPHDESSVELSITGKLMISRFVLSGTKLSKSLVMDKDVTGSINNFTFEDVKIPKKQGDNDTGSLTFIGNLVKTGKVNNCIIDTETTIGNGSGIEYAPNEDYPILEITGLTTNHLNVNADGTKDRDLAPGYKKITISNNRIDELNISSTKNKGSVTETVIINSLNPVGSSVGSSNRIKIDCLPALNAYTATDLPYCQSMTISNSGNANSKGHWSILGMGYSITNPKATLDVNTSNGVDTLVIGEINNHKTYLQKLDIGTDSVPSDPTKGIKNLNIDGLQTTGTIQVKNGIGQFIIGNSAGNHSSSISEINFTNARGSLEKLVFYGSTTDTWIGKIDLSNACSTVFKMDGTTYSGKLASIVAQNVDANGKSLSVDQLRFDNAQINYDDVFRPAVKLMSSTGRIFANEAIFIRKYGRIDLAGSSTPQITTVEVTTEVPDKEEYYAILQEVIATSVTGNEDAAMIEAKKVHGMACYDTIKQNEFLGGVLADCTKDCKNDVDNVNGLTLHYHAPDPKGGVYILSETREAAGIQSGTMAHISARAEKTIKYKADGKVSVTLNEGTVNEETLEPYYNWTNGYTVEHLGEGINKKHDPNNPSDGCVLKITYSDGTGSEILQTVGWNVNSYERIEDVGVINVDPVHTEKGYACNEEGTPYNLESKKDNKGFLSVNRSLKIMKLSQNSLEGNTELNNKMEAMGLNSSDKSMVIVQTVFVPQDPIKETKEVTTYPAATDRINTLSLTDTTVAKLSTAADGTVIGTRFDTVTLNLGLRNLQKFSYNISDRKVQFSRIDNAFFSSCRSLRELELKYNALTDFYIDARNLTSLNLQGNMLGSKKDKRTMKEVYVNGIWYYTYFYGGCSSWAGGNKPHYMTQSWPEGMTYFNMQENDIEIKSAKGDACDGWITIQVTLGSGSNPGTAPSELYNFWYEGNYGGWVSTSGSVVPKGTYTVTLTCDSHWLKSEGTRMLTVYPWGK